MPVISALSYTVTDSTIVAVWTTDVSADSNLSAGGKAAIDNGVAANGTSHQCIVTGLLPSTVYSCFVTSGGTSSSPQNVTTSAVQTRTAIVAGWMSAPTQIGTSPQGDTYRSFCSNDGSMYMSQDDGNGFVAGSPNGGFNTEIGKITNETTFAGTLVSLTNYGGFDTTNGTDGPGGAAMTNKSTGLIGLNGNLHYFVYRQFPPTFSTNRYCNWIKSTDHGATWNNFTALTTFTAGGNPVTPNSPAEPVQFYDLTIGIVSPVLYAADDGTLGYNTAGNQIDGGNGYIYCTFIKDAASGVLYLMRIPRIQFDAQSTTSFQYWVGPSTPAVADFVNDTYWSSSPTSTTNILTAAGAGAWFQMAFVPTVNYYIMTTWISLSPGSKVICYTAPTPAGPWTASFTSQSFLTAGQIWYGPFPVHRDVISNTDIRHIRPRITFQGAPGGGHYQLNWSVLILATTQSNLNVLFVDNFTRANENPLSDGGQWSAYQETGSNVAQLQVLNNLCESTTLSVRNIGIVTGTSFTSNQWSEFTLGAALANIPTLGIRCRLTSGNPGTGYEGIFSNGTYFIRRFTGTTFTTITSGAGTLNISDTIRLEVIGTALTLYKNDVSILTTTDATYSSGSVGIVINPQNPLTNAIMSLFRAGNLSVAQPVISPNGGAFSSSQTVTLTDLDSGLAGFAMYYTTDGSTPTTASTLYTVPFTVNRSLTVKAYATATNNVDSAVSSASFTVTSSGSGTNNDMLNLTRWCTRLWG